jgi:hypothetical protein
MAKTNPTASPEILEAALHGLELQREKLEEQIAQVRSMLGRRVGRPPRTAKSAVEPDAKSGRGRRKLSDEARKRIAAAQKKRWAAFRKAGGKKA